ncbi:MAG TPA: TIGR03088 family PEP-CTERM/XrtA system glycosyltransferase [Steroidobacteraceae bacterium]|nr:TIGR03088 family PEP-CTERM/XrtA system glycosyltransferase [Steroidobacteraceae bacterium]HNS28527.1 TIGR03088 family PEP-CTERM/XrtA system glycosyltransferase [Steroidobacteraceae bacterium]
MAEAPLIAHVIYRLDYGGLENGLVNLVNRLPRAKYRHAIVCLAGFTDFRKRIQRDDVEVISIDKQPGKDPAAYGRLWRQLRRLRPAVVHTRNLGTVDLQWVALAAGVRHRVHGEHGWDAADPRGESPRALRIRRLCRPATQRYVAVSKDIERWLQERIKVPPGRIRQIYNGVDVDRFSPEGPLPADLPWAVQGAERPLVIGTIGRLDPIKNQAALLEAFARLAKAPEAPQGRLRLAIVGDGPEAGRLRERAQALGIAPLVWMPGMRPDAPALLRSFDIFVLPSQNEGISNTILEAMASSRPVVAGQVGGNGELIEQGVSGTLYDPRDPAALAAAIARYLDDGGLRAAHGAAGRERCLRAFAMDSMVQAYTGLYDGLLTDH